MDMTPPNVKFVTLKEEMEYLGESMEVDELVQITFNLEIGDLLQSKMYQILPISEAKRNGKATSVSNGGRRRDCHRRN